MSRPAAACIASLLLLQAAQAQEPGLRPVQVIERAPVPGLGIPAGQVPANVQGADAAQIERSQAPDLSSFLNRRMPGVYVNETQGNAFQPDVFYRGYAASPLLGTPQGLSLYLDGVRLNQPFGDVVSWDLVPKSAIADLTVMPGSNPLFGLNTLGGALAVQTKDGRRHAGTSVQGLAGSHGRFGAEFETGGSRDDGLHWYGLASALRDDGWRAESPSRLLQLFGKLGHHSSAGDVALTVAAARNSLTGNGLQEQGLLQSDYESVYTRPDETKNRALLLNLALQKPLGDAALFSGNVYWRRIKTPTFNADINDEAFGQDVYAPGEDAANTPFPSQRCIDEAAVPDEPAERCSGVLNRTETTQSNWGLTGQVEFAHKLGGISAQSLLGLGLDFSKSRFRQGSELGYVNPDRSVTGVGAFGDGVTGGEVDGEPYDTRVDLSGRSRAWSVYGSSVLAATERTHITVAGRYNHQQVRNRDAILPGGGPGSLDGEQTFARFNPALGITFQAAPGLGFYAGVSQGSRAPSSIELGCADPANPCKLPNAFAGDPPLRQVVATTLEAGLRGGRNGFSWNAGVFSATNRDDLLFVSNDPNGFGYFRNFGKTRRQGVELGANLALGRTASIGANYTWLDATFRTAETVDGSSNSSNSAAQDGFAGTPGTIAIRPGDRIPLVPRQLFKLFGEWRVAPAWSLGADLLAVGGSPARGNENGEHQPDGAYYLGSGRSPGYAVVNLNTEWRPQPRLKLFAQVNNLFDRQYASAAQLGPTGFDANGNYRARPLPADGNGDFPLQHSTFLAPGAPRAFWVGLRVSL